MRNIATSKVAKGQIARLEHTPGKCAHDWWKHTDDSVATLDRKHITAAADDDSVKLMEVPVGKTPQTETVLVVDDEPLIREFIVQFLRESGYQVLEASGAMEAQQLTLTNQNISLLLTDFSMPGTNGLELARWFQGKYPGMKVLIATGAMWELANQVGEQEQMAVLLKPFDVSQLSRMVRLALK